MIILRDIYKTYQMGAVQVKALDGVSLSIQPGEFVAIMGPSGSGKSTLLHILGLLDRPDSGSYTLNQKELTGLSQEQSACLRNSFMGFVFQQFHLLPRMNAVENIELPLLYAGRQNIKGSSCARPLARGHVAKPRHGQVLHQATGMPVASDAVKERAEKAADAVGLKDRMHHRPNELSGGQQQRVAIARALVNEPLIILADEPTGNLDTKSEKEILGLLQKLNDQGKTIVVVTHEKEIAENAKRIIHMRDGRIISDERTQAPIKPESLAGKEKQLSVDALESATPGRAKFFDYFKQACFAMITHKMRSILSILGILIGVASVIAMLALGQGAKNSIEQQLASLGSNLLVIHPGSSRVHGVALEAGSVTRFTPRDSEIIKGLTGLISRVSPSVTGRGQLVYENKNWNTQIEGVDVDFAPMRASVPQIGRFFTEAEVKTRAKVVVLGLAVAKELFGESDPVGKIIKINLINFKVLGVLPAKGSMGFRDPNDTVIIPFTTAMYRLLGKQYLDNIYAEVVAPELVEQAQSTIKDMIIKQHRVRSDPDDFFEIRNMADIRSTLETTTKTMSLLLGSIAAISLLVGGIGIMNIMLVSVTERTREIGLRKAIGANNHDILVQFLIEAVLLSLLGGLGGIALGCMVSLLITHVAKWTVEISMFSVILATVFSLVVGVLFGLWPARQASRLDPIEALRYE